ncbi:D,D-heptose 1,7-bisphosphate phosphatase [Rhodoblastus sphagnicola]|uniref:D,D-heptose 1,7-bisphosphate phosphatase n=1 Tax=Rhodoblastus sphagnicola TaxID=333368 RepID=A0A2S6ND21_9HYPH|nr:HAD family hydrolase [Rhodoblastus sphagnicola]MBB4198067.1 D-glycero-D-manno-heptose 1,7-bisphosphate phosphatase [Rhodoblastus sphagnicola]PPQ32507.1 D,D-heptose 1,7-bisphosphate phosphatase [Rhodoblastus sphagnicola]
MVQAPVRAVFLDRDGVLNRALVRDGKPFPPASLAEMEILPGAADAARRLAEAGFLLIVVTNQPDVARGTTARETVEAINGAIGKIMPIAEFRTCYHDSADGCDCRKPKPGALLAAARAHGVDLGRSFMVGDRWRDVEAGRAAGCQTVFIDYGYDEKQPEVVDITVGSLEEAARRILETC